MIEALAWLGLDWDEVCVQSGIKAVLNYAPIHLLVPPDVHVQYTDPITHLQRMTYYL